jgi:hypothetical protein
MSCGNVLVRKSVIGVAGLGKKNPRRGPGRIGSSFRRPGVSRTNTKKRSRCCVARPKVCTSWQNLSTSRLVLEPEMILAPRGRTWSSPHQTGFSVGAKHASPAPAAHLEPSSSSRDPCCRPVFGHFLRFPGLMRNRPGPPPAGSARLRAVCPVRSATRAEFLRRSGFHRRGRKRFRAGDSRL